MKNIINFIKNNKLVKIVYNVIKAFIFIILIGYIAFILFQMFSNNSALFGYRVFSIATGSMEPVYNVNDVIYVKEVDPNTLKVGDDIVYKGDRSGFEGMIITHRIIKIEDSSDGKLRITTQGVNNEYEDPSISSDQVLGKVQGKIFFINTLNHAVKSWGYFFIVFLPLVLVIVLEVIETVVEMKIEKNEIRKYGSGDEDEDEEDEEDDESDDEDEDNDVVEDIDEKVEEPSKVEEGEEEDEEII